MAFLSLLPAIGSALIWFPVSLYLLATGAVWHGLALVVYGALVIGLVDNFLRPFLIGMDTKLPDYVVLISTLGGIAIFGPNGFADLLHLGQHAAWLAEYGAAELQLHRVARSQQAFIEAFGEKVLPSLS